MLSLRFVQQLLATSAQQFVIQLLHFALLPGYRVFRTKFRYGRSIGCWIGAQRVDVLASWDNLRFIMRKRSDGSACEETDRRSGLRDAHPRGSDVRPKIRR